MLWQHCFPQEQTPNDLDLDIKIESGTLDSQATEEDLPEPESDAQDDKEDDPEASGDKDKDTAKQALNLSDEADTTKKRKHS